MCYGVFQGYNISMNEIYGALFVIFALIQNNYYQRKSVRTLEAAENRALKKAL